MTFKTLSEAKRAGWQIECRNAGPCDIEHYGASIYHPTKGNAYLLSRNADWTIQQARTAALARINELEAALVTA